MGRSVGRCGRGDLGDTVALGAHLDKEPVCPGRVGTPGHGRGSVPAPPNLLPSLSLYRLFMARLCLSSGAAGADGCNCSNKILIARSRACLRLWE